jgi:hypothetical protein
MLDLADSVCHELHSSGAVCTLPRHLPLFLSDVYFFLTSGKQYSDGMNTYFYTLTTSVRDKNPNPFLPPRFVRRGRSGNPRTLNPFWQVHPGLLYTQVLKVTHRRRLLATFPGALFGSLSATRYHLQAAGSSGIIQTAFIERLSITFRHGIATLVQRTWETYNYPSHLTPRLELFRAYYDFVRLHRACPAQSSLARPQ